MIIDKNKDFPNTIIKEDELSKELNEVSEVIEENVEALEEMENEHESAIENSLKNDTTPTSRITENPAFDNEINLKQNAYERYKNIDWARLSPKAVMQVLAEVMLENKRLIQESIQNKNYISELEKSNFSVAKAKKELDGILDSIAGQLYCCRTVLQRVNDGEKISLNEKADLIVKYVSESETNHLNREQTYISKIKDYKKILTDLQNQIYDLTAKQNTEISKNEQKYDESDIEKMINLTPKSEEFILTATPLSKAKSLADEPLAEAILEAIGKHGISEFPEIASFCASNYGFNDQKVEEMIFDLEKQNIIQTTLIKPFNRSRGVRLVAIADAVGLKVYKDKFGVEPIESEMAKIRRENDNYEHGYCIKDVYKQLLATGYSEMDTSMERAKNTITISGNVTWVPDIIAKNPVSKKIEYYEIETGKCNQKDLEYKLDKAVLVTDKVKIIVPNKVIADSYLEYVKNWYNSKKTSPAITIVILSFQEFKTKDKNSIRAYPKISKEDVNVSNEIFNEIKNN